MALLDRRTQRPTRDDVSCLLDALALAHAQTRDARADLKEMERVAVACVEALTANRRALDAAQAELATTAAAAREAMTITSDAVSTAQDAVRFAEESAAQAAAARSERYFALCAGCSAPIGEPHPQHHDH